MYTLVDALAETEVDLGTNLLVSGPPLSGKRRLALQILARGAADGEGAIVVTTKDSGTRILSQFEEYLESYGSFGTRGDEVPVAVVDCVSKQHSVDDTAEDPRISYASSPVDMTGIGINISEIFEEFYVDRSLRRNRLLVHSLSTLLMYSNLQTVFRFLHVLTGRVQSVDALGVYVIDSTAHDDQTVNTLTQLFDGIVEVSDDGEPSLRMSGSN